MREVLGSPAALPALANVEDTDRALVVAAREGDRRGFETIVRTYQKRVYGLALRMTRRHDVADEIAQETFVRAFTNLDRFELGRPLMPWLARIATNLALNHLASAPVRRETSLPDDHEPPAPRSASHDGEPLRALLSSELTRALDAAIEKLPAEQKAVFVLKVQEELRYEEIAEVLGISLGTVMSRLSRARAKLKTMLRDHL